MCKSVSSLVLETTKHISFIQHEGLVKQVICHPCDIYDQNAWEEREKKKNLSLG